MATVLSYKLIFNHTGSEYDPASNVVSVGSDSGKFILKGITKHQNLVTKGVASCVAVVAVNHETAETGLWHLHHNERSEGIAAELIPTLAKYFDPRKTDIYLVGGKRGLSEKLVDSLLSCIADADFHVTDSILYREDKIDIAVYKDGSIYIAPEHRPEYLFYKPAPQEISAQSNTMGTTFRRLAPV